MQTENGTTKIKAVVFDLDGTVSNDDHRKPLLPPQPWSKASQEDFHAYHAGCILDTVHDDLATIWYRYQKLCPVIVMTARPEMFNGVTKAWLDKHSFEHSRLYMRPDGDKSRAYELKVDWVQEAQKRFNIIAFFDDNRNVIQHINLLGITTYHITRKDTNGTTQETSRAI